MHKSNLPPGVGTSKLPGFTDQDKEETKIQQIMDDKDVDYDTAVEIYKQIVREDKIDGYEY